MFAGNLLAVAAGGALGAVCRWLLVSKLSLMSEFPYGTLTVNVIGCFLIGVLVALMTVKPNESLRLFLIVGLLGGFTTFSAFSLDTLVLIQKHEFVSAFVYAGTSLFASLFAVAGGYGLGQLFIPQT